MLKGGGSSFSLDIGISRWQHIVDENIFLFQKHAERERETEREGGRGSWKAINKQTSIIQVVIQ